MDNKKKKKHIHLHPHHLIDLHIHCDAAAGSDITEGGNSQPAETPSDPLTNRRSETSCLSAQNEKKKNERKQEQRLT